MDLRVPRPLRVLHGAIRGRQVCAQNRLVEPAALAVEDGKLVFYVENQGVHVWATEPDGEDPRVFVRDSGSQAAWSLEADTLSGFLIQVLLLEAIFGAPFGASTDGLAAKDLRKVKKRVPACPIPPWSTSRTEFFAHEGVIGFANPDADLFSVWLGAKDRTRMETVENLLVEWPDVRC